MILRQLLGKVGIVRWTNLPTKQRQSEQTSKKQRQDQLISELISPEGIVLYVLIESPHGGIRLQERIAGVDRVGGSLSNFNHAAG